MSQKTKLLLACGPIGALLFILVFLTEGVLRQDYNPMRFPLSSLSIGEHGWVQISNFLVSGSLIIAFSFGLRKATFKLNNSKTLARLIDAVGIGLFGAGIFSTDPIYGYPTTEPLRLAQFTVHGHLHDFFSIFVFICLPIACFKFRKVSSETGHHRLANYSLISGLAMLATFVLAAIGFKQVTGFVEIAGVFQRCSVIIGCAWIATLGFYLRKDSNAEMLNQQ